jgi:cell division septal protein FtsQ
VEEREPEFLWCNDECFFLDIEGYIFDQAPQFTGSGYVSFFGELNAEGANPIGEQFLEGQEFSKISTLISGMKILTLNPAEVRVMAQYEYEVTLATGETVLVATVEPVEGTLANLKAVLLDPKLSLRSGSTLSFETLDMRYGNKVFFIKKGE